MRPFSRHPFSFLSRVGLILVLLSWSSPLHAKETDEDMPVVAVGEKTFERGPAAAELQVGLRRYAGSA